jgi:hypothetical protein
MPRIKVQFFQKDNSLEGRSLKEIVVIASSAHKGEIEHAVANELGVSHFDIDARKFWEQS